MIKKIAIGVSLISALGFIAFIAHKASKKKIDNHSILDHIGKTPLIYLPKLSKALKCSVYVI